jgi:hypothetical protein
MATKSPRHPARVPSVAVVRSLLAPVPPRTSVLPPGAGNEEAKKALKPDNEGAKKTEDRNVRQTRVVQRHLDTPTIRANRDGDMASIATIEQTQDWSPAHARPIRAVRAVYEAFGDHATSGQWPRGARPWTSVGWPQVSTRRFAAIKRPPVARRSLPHHFNPRVEGDSLPALPRLENDGGACQSRQDQKNPEGLSLQHPSHLINTSAGRRRG